LSEFISSIIVVKSYIRQNFKNLKPQQRLFRQISSFYTSYSNRTCQI